MLVLPTLVTMGNCIFIMLLCEGDWSNIDFTCSKFGEVERTPIEGRKRARRKTEIVRGLVTEFSLDMLLKIIKLARSTYYYHLKKLNQVDKNQSIKVEIQAIYDEHKGNYGYRRITLELRNRGFVVNQKKVQRLINLLGLSSQIRRKRKYSSYQGEVGKKADNPYSTAV